MGLVVYYDIEWWKLHRTGPTTHRSCGGGSPKYSKLELIMRPAEQRATNWLPACHRTWGRNCHLVFARVVELVETTSSLNSMESRHRNKDCWSLYLTTWWKSRDQLTAILISFAWNLDSSGFHMLTVQLTNLPGSGRYQCDCKDSQTILWDSLALAPIHSFQCDGITQWWCFTLICLVLSRIPCGHCQPPILMVCPQDCIVVAFVICKFIRQQISMVQWKTLAQRHCTCWSICCNSSSCRVGNCPRGQVLWRMKELLI